MVIALGHYWWTSRSLGRVWLILASPASAWGHLGGASVSPIGCMVSPLYSFYTGCWTKWSSWGCPMEICQISWSVGVVCGPQVQPSNRWVGDNCCPLQLVSHFVPTLKLCGLVIIATHILHSSWCDQRHFGPTFDFVGW